MKYKVGDKVRIKSLDWYNENKDNLSFYTDSMALCFANEIVTIKSYGRYPDTYRIDEDEGDFLWTDEMIEGLVEEEEIEFTEEDKYWCDIMSESDPTTYVLPQGYQFKDENGNVINAQKIVLKKKKPKYPVSYKESLDILNYRTAEDVVERTMSLSHLERLLVCRDAYWSLAGDWKPDWAMYSGQKHCIIYSDNQIKWQGKSFVTESKVLAFPTPEMRDTFYENFKELIEECKELL